MPTLERVEQYQGKLAILQTWEEIAPSTLQANEAGYVGELRKRVRQIRNYIINRADPQANIL